MQRLIHCLWLFILVDPDLNRRCVYKCNHSAGIVCRNESIRNKVSGVVTVKDITNTNKAVAFKLLFLEAILTSIAALVLGLGFGKTIAVSVLLGGFAFIVPNTYFAKYVFKFDAQESPRMALRGFYFGEVIKIIATVFIFIFGFVLVKDINIAVLILTYVILLIINLWGFSSKMSNPPETAGEMEKEHGS